MRSEPSKSATRYFHQRSFSATRQRLQTASAKTDGSFCLSTLCFDIMLRDGLTPNVNAVFEWSKGKHDLPDPNEPSTTFYQIFSPDALTKLLAQTCISASMPTIVSLHTGELASVPARNNVIHPAAKYNVLGMYIHLGRWDGQSLDMSRGFYLGSAAGASPESYAGFSIHRETKNHPKWKPRCPSTAIQAQERRDSAGPPLSLRLRASMAMFDPKDVGRK